MTRFATSLFFASTTGVVTLTSAFVPSTNIVNLPSPTTKAAPISTTSSALYAIGVLAKKAKEATLREYISGGVEDSVMEQYKVIKEALSNDDDDDDDTSAASAEPGPFQQSITKRKGTITVIAEYKRKLSDSGYVQSIFDPEIMSPEFREFGASGIAVMADEKMGGCTYEDLKAFVEEQRRAKNEVIGSVPVINNDLIIDELQIAQSAAYGCKAITLQYDILGEELTTKLLKAARAVNLEVIVAVSSNDEAQSAIDKCGARRNVGGNPHEIANRIVIVDPHHAPL